MEKGETQEEDDSSRSSKRAKLDDPPVSAELNWYYKTDDVTQGPLSSSEMFEMQTKGYNCLSVNFLAFFLHLCPSFFRVFLVFYLFVRPSVSLSCLCFYLSVLLQRILAFCSVLMILL